MKLNKTEDYAILIISFLAKEKEISSVSKICKNLNLPMPFTRKILNMLLKSGLVKGVEGTKGGYILAKKIDNLNLYEILESIGSSISITDCLTCECSVYSSCLTKDVFQKLNKEIILKFKEIKIKDFI
jgi:Rrf2 family protein